VRSLIVVYVALARVQFVFLDRDGVINRKLPEGQFVTRREHLDLLPGAAKAVAKLNCRRLTVILVTKQRAIGLGLLTQSELTQLHGEMQKVLAGEGAHLDAICYCPHDPAHQTCTCRKPGTGMFEQAILDFPSATKEDSLVGGDSLSIRYPGWLSDGNVHHLY
jgi:D-glycero-D-manno-heptose 1,7-bisphosphate phosphatase